MLSQLTRNFKKQILFQKLYFMATKESTLTLKYMDIKPELKFIKTSFQFINNQNQKAFLNSL
jgi:hypothetical protein